MQDNFQTKSASENPEAVIAGTMCLMSFFGQTRCPQAAHKIEHNLRVLVQHPYLSDAFRDVCENLLSHWHRTCTAMTLAEDEASSARLH